MTGEDDVTLREALNRPMEVIQMYGTVGERKTGLKTYCTQPRFAKTDVIKISNMRTIIPKNSIW